MTLHWVNCAAELVDLLNPTGVPRSSETAAPSRTLQWDAAETPSPRVRTQHPPVRPTILIIENQLRLFICEVRESLSRSSYPPKALLSANALVRTRSVLRFLEACCFCTRVTPCTALRRRNEREMVFYFRTTSASTVVFTGWPDAQKHPPCRPFPRTLQRRPPQPGPEAPYYEAKNRTPTRRRASVVTTNPRRQVQRRRCEPQPALLTKSLHHFCCSLLLHLLPSVFGLSAAAGTAVLC